MVYRMCACGFLRKIQQIYPPFSAFYRTYAFQSKMGVSNRAQLDVVLLRYNTKPSSAPRYNNGGQQTFVDIVPYLAQKAHKLSPCMDFFACSIMGALR